MIDLLLDRCLTPSVMQLPSKRLRRDNLEEEEGEMVVEEGAADIDEVEDGEELKQKIEDLEKVIAEKNIENVKLKEVLNKARSHLRMVLEDHEKSDEFEALEEQNRELKCRLKQNYEQIENLEALKEENKELESRLKQKNEEVENLYALNEENHELKSFLQQKNKEIESIEENKELKSRLEQKNKEIESLGAVTEENKELELRLKQDHEKVLGNLEAQVASLSSQNQLESSQNEKLKTKNNRLQEDIETAHKTIQNGLTKIKIQDAKILELECQIKNTYSPVADLEAMQSKIENLEKTLKEKEIVLNQV